MWRVYNYKAPQRGNVARSFSYDDINDVLRCSGKLQAERGKLLAPNKLPDMNDKN